MSGLPRDGRGNSPVYAVEVARDVIVPEPKHGPTLRLQTGGPLPVGLQLFAVMAAIELDRKLQRTAGKIDDMVVDDELTREAWGTVAKHLPELAFSRGRFAPKRTGVVRQLGRDALHDPPFYQASPGLHPPPPLPSREQVQRSAKAAETPVLHAHVMPVFPATRRSSASALSHRHTPRAHRQQSGLARLCNAYSVHFSPLPNAAPESRRQSAARKRMIDEPSSPTRQAAQAPSPPLPPRRAKDRPRGPAGTGRGSHRRCSPPRSPHS